jgi:hypothetical protein
MIKYEGKTNRKTGLKFWSATSKNQGGEKTKRAKKLTSTKRN